VLLSPQRETSKRNARKSEARAKQHCGFSICTEHRSTGRQSRFSVLNRTYQEQEDGRDEQTQRDGSAPKHNKCSNIAPDQTGDTEPRNHGSKSPHDATLSDTPGYELTAKSGDRQ
jgi:hypothetical protein